MLEYILYYAILIFITIILGVLAIVTVCGLIVFIRDKFF